VSSNSSRRLPGVRFELPAPPVDSALPRMDIAMFVGFAGSGPLRVPVAVESLTEFEAVFGESLSLARDPATGTAVTALLHPSVRSFFSQGGLRCWVLRVAGEDAERSWFPVPGLLCLARSGASEAWKPMPALLSARSPGSGSDDIMLAARGSRQTMVTRVLSSDASSLTLELADADARQLRSGDLLRWGAETRGYGRVGSVSAVVERAGQPLRARIRLEGLAAVRPRGSRDVPAELRLPAPAPDGSLGSFSAPVQAAWLTGDSLQLTATLPAERLPQLGAVLELAFARADEAAWMAVEQVVLQEVMDFDGSVAVRIVGRAWELAPWLVPGEGTQLTMSRLRLDLQATRAGRRTRREQLALACDAQAPGSGESVFDLPDDDLAYAGSASERARTVDPLPLAAPRLLGELLWVPLLELPDFGPQLGALHSARSALERDGLRTFSWQLFTEPVLTSFSADALADRAEALRLGGETLRTLHGVHALFGCDVNGLLEEPSILAVPDAVHAGWEAVPDTAPAWTELDGPPAPPGPPPGRFLSCTLEPLPVPRFVRAADPSSRGDFTLLWTVGFEAGDYELEEASDASFAAAVPIYLGAARRFSIAGKRAGEVFYRVRVVSGERRGDWSRPVRVHVRALGFATVPFRDDELLAIHRSMLRVAAGRGDVLALLGLPRHYDGEQAAQHAAALRATRELLASDTQRPPPIGVDEQRALSHGALHHPWLSIRRVDEVIWFPPDGAVAGQLALGAATRGAWLAVANQPLRDVVAAAALGALASRDERQRLFEAQVNLLYSAARGFVIGSADTLTGDPLWRPISVRRLMCLLRRLAMQRGPTYVFEPHDAVLRRTVERDFEALLDTLFRRGAFAGSDASAAYRVVVGEPVNTPQRRELGQFWVELRVAPALPMEFLTVRLARSGERVLSREVH
jgi:hypothetical protein